MRRLFTPAILALALLATAGCAKRVKVAHVAAPVVPVDTSAVAVVAAERACQDTAKALIDALGERPGVTVRPHAPVRLYVTGCETLLRPSVDLAHHEDGDQLDTSRRIRLEGRGVALVALVVDQEVQAHLLGSSRAYQGSDAKDSVPAMRRAVARDLVDSVADDLAEQLRPMPRLAARRVYPRADVASARGLHSRAVEAERNGDYVAARRLALQAWRADPSPRSLTYLRELDDLLVRLR